MKQRGQLPAGRYRSNRGRQRRRGGIASSTTRVHPHVVFLRLCGAAGFGVFLGLAIAGLVGIVTGRAFADGTEWLAGVPILAVFGMPLGAVVAWLTRRWFLPATPRRWLFFTAAGLLALPLATAVGQGETSNAVVFPIIAIGGLTTVMLWQRGFRREVAPGQALRYGRFVRRHSHGPQYRGGSRRWS